MKEFLQLVRSGLYGVCVADALGVPVESKSREALVVNPVIDMRGYGTNNQPPGTWSDDSSMTLALADSIGKKQGIHTHDIMDRFISWYREELYTAWGERFDIGHTTAQALMRYESGVEPVLCGGNKQSSNGNGSLMRILPVVYALYPRYGANLSAHTKPMEYIHKVSGLTHRHPVAKSACGIYVNIASFLLKGTNLEEAVSSGISDSLAWYDTHDPFSDYTDVWERITDVERFRKLPEKEIKSGGYVVETLEAAIWCLLNTNNYEECVLKAVNLGYDTDTTAAVAGGLAGLYYGFDDIPADWIDTLANKMLIEKISFKLAEYMKTIEKKKERH